MMAKFKMSDACFCLKT